MLLRLRAVTVYSFTNHGECDTDITTCIGPGGGPQVFDSSRDAMQKREYEILSSNLKDCAGILGRDEFLNSAVMVPFVFLDGEYHLLFQKRAEGISQGSEICFPGGKFDCQKDSDSQQTAMRETMEELGLARRKITIHGRFDTLVTPMGILVEAFAGHVDIAGLHELSPQEDEVEEVFTLPVSWFRSNRPEVYHNRVEVHPSYVDEAGEEQILLPVDELGLPPLYKKKRNGWQHRVYVYKTPKYVIWGITAAIIHGVVGKVDSLLGSAPV